LTSHYLPTFPLLPPSPLEWPQEQIPIAIILQVKGLTQGMKAYRQMQGPRWQVASPGVSAIFHVRNNQFTDLHSFFSCSNVHHGTATHSSHQPNENTPPSQLGPITITMKPISTYPTPHHPSHMHGNLHPSSHSYHSLQHSAPALMTSDPLSVTTSPIAPYQQ